MVLNNCTMKSYLGLYGNCRRELSLYLKIELILILDFDSESMGLAERVTSKVKAGKVCLSLVLLPLQDLQYVLFFIRSIFSNSSNEFSIIGFVWLIQVHAVCRIPGNISQLPSWFIFTNIFLLWHVLTKSYVSVFMLVTWCNLVAHRYSLTFTSRFTF